MECQETDEDVMRVFVPRRIGAARARISGASARLRAGAGAQVRHLRASVPTLEDVFARAIGEA